MFRDLKFTIHFSRGIKSKRGRPVCRRLAGPSREQRLDGGSSTGCLLLFHRLLLLLLFLRRLCRWRLYRLLPPSAALRLRPRSRLPPRLIRRGGLLGPTSPSPMRGPGGFGVVCDRRPPHARVARRRRPYVWAGLVCNRRPPFAPRPPPPTARGHVPTWSRHGYGKTHRETLSKTPS